jgi:pimeloyl-ACP methyl ester carboxylesterase
MNNVFFSHELDNITPYGKLVKVNGQNMHVYSLGEGAKTIVLLPGFGVPLPSADFGPLMRELSKEYTVVCIEYFGVGFSDETEVPRTNENYTEEVRTVLSLAGFKAPYVLMPHSGSGIYSEYYATKYPDEVSAIIMLDTTSSAKTETNVPKFIYELSKVQQAIGFGRIINPFVVSSVLKMNRENGYTEQEIDDYTKFMNHYYNDTFKNQLSRLNDNILEVMKMDFPDEVPVLKLIAAQTTKKVSKDYQTNHLNRLGANAESITLNCSHFIYHTNVSDICDATTTFLFDN